MIIYTKEIGSLFRKTQGDDSGKLYRSTAAALANALPPAPIENTPSLGETGQALTREIELKFFQRNVRQARTTGYFADLSFVSGFVLDGTRIYWHATETEKAPPWFNGQILWFYGFSTGAAGPVKDVSFAAELAAVEQFSPLKDGGYEWNTAVLITRWGELPPPQDAVSGAPPDMDFRFNCQVRV